MSTQDTAATDSTDAQPADESAERLALVEDRLDAQSNRMDIIEEDLRAENAELREQVEALQAEKQTLEEEINQLRARTDLLALVEDSDELTAKQRQTILIQNLKRAAEKEADRGRAAKASLSPDEAEAALNHPYDDETHVYRDMKRAAALLGDTEILWYDSSGYGNTRLKIDLTEGSVPAAITERIEN